MRASLGSDSGKLGVRGRLHLADLHGRGVDLLVHDISEVVEVPFDVRDHFDAASDNDEKRPARNEDLRVGLEVLHSLRGRVGPPRRRPRGVASLSVVSRSTQGRRVWAAYLKLRLHISRHRKQNREN